MLDSLGTQRYMALETHKRDGSWVSTPVNLIVEGDRVYFRTWDKSGKAKRLRNYSDVRFAASTARGRRTGPALRGKASLLAGEDDRRIASLINRKHPILQGFTVRFGHKLMRYRTQHYVITNVVEG
jgi:uncharacterized protein